MVKLSELNWLIVDYVLDGWGVIQYVNVFCISIGYFSCLCCDVIGVGVIVYIEQIIMEEVCCMFVFIQFLILEIGYCFGYDDLFYFLK